MQCRIALWSHCITSLLNGLDHELPLLEEIIMAVMLSWDILLDWELKDCPTLSYARIGEVIKYPTPPSASLWLARISPQNCSQWVFPRKVLSLLWAQIQRRGCWIQKALAQKVKWFLDQKNTVCRMTLLYCISRCASFTAKVTQKITALTLKLGWSHPALLGFSFVSFSSPFWVG